jgi:sporulation protein YlmC with PRC-barrel domain
VTHQATFDLVRDLLDHEIVDSEGVSCGMVDDVQLALGDEGLAVTALRCGPAVSAQRLPAWLRVAARACGVQRRVRVPMAELESMTEVVTLKRRAAELGLGVAERRVARWLARIVGTS